VLVGFWEPAAAAASVLAGDGCSLATAATAPMRRLPPRRPAATDPDGGCCFWFDDSVLPFRSVAYEKLCLVLLTLHTAGSDVLFI
jgi:hypothetical protein